MKTTFQSLVNSPPLKMILLFISFFPLAVPVQATILKGPTSYNGHTYYLLDKKSWAESEVEAISMGGHLVTVNDSNEWVFLIGQYFKSSYMNAGYEVEIWLGLNDADGNGSYTWRSGEQPTFLAPFAPPAGQFGTISNEPEFQGFPESPPPTQQEIEFVAAHVGAVTVPGTLLYHGIVEVAPRLSLSIDSTPTASGGSYAFPALPPGQQSSITVTISNNGTLPISGIAPTISPSGSNYQLGATPPTVTLAVGSTTTFGLIYAPQSGGIPVATLSIASNAEFSPHVVQLSTTGGNDDTTPPVITAPASALTVDCDASDKNDVVNAWLVNHGGATATDNSGTVTWTHNFSSLPAACTSAPITFAASDPDGNTTLTAANLTVTDATPPAITTPAAGLAVVSDGAGNSTALNTWLVNHGGAVATDTSGTVTWTNNFTTLPNNSPQTVPVIFSASDLCGNFTTTSANFTILSAAPPEITVTASDFYGDCDDAVTDIATYLNSHGGAQATANQGPLTWTNDYNGTLPSCKGYVTVTFTASDAGGGSATTSSRFFLFPPGAVWVGPAVGNWSTAAGWDDSTLPTALTDTYVDLFDFQNTTVTATGSKLAKNLFIGQDDSLVVGNGSATSYLEVAGDAIQIDGTLKIGHPGGGVNALYVRNSTTLAGTGKVILQGPGRNFIERGTNSILDVLTVSSGQEITTTADTIAEYQSTAIKAGIINYGTITADQGGMTLYYNPKTNNGIFQAINGGRLRMQVPIDNTNGQLIADTGSVIDLQSTLTGGSVSGQGLLRMNLSTATLTGLITLGSGLTTAIEGSVYLDGTITNEGLITMGLAEGAGVSWLYINGAVRLEGSGLFRFQGSGRRQFIPANPGLTTDVLTIGPDQEITTNSTTVAEYQNSSIQAALNNLGTVTADGGGLDLYSRPKTNHGIFRAINGGTMRIEATVDNTNGTILASTDSTVMLQTTLTGGTVTGTGQMLINSTAGLNGPITLDSGLTTAVDAGGTTLTGNITHNGQMTLGNPAGTGSPQFLINGPVSLQGTGKIIFQGNGGRQILRKNNATTDVLTIAPGIELTTDINTGLNYQKAAIHAPVENYGIITANGGGLTIYSGAKTNHGTFRAINGGTMAFTSVTVTNYNATTDTLTGGRWEVASTGTTTTLDLQNSPIATIAANTFVCLSGADAAFPQLSGLVTIAGTFCLENGKIFTTAGNLAVSGTLQFGLGNGSTQGFDSQRLVINGNVNFTGSHIDVRSLGTTPGLYEIARWTGTATGTPTLGNVPPGHHYALVFDTEGKTLKVNVEGVPGGELKILGIQYVPATGTTTIDYLSQPGVIHQVRGTSDFVNYDNLPDTAVGTGALMQYIHVSPNPPTKYFYKFSIQP